MPKYKWFVSLYQKANGRCPVQDYLEDLIADDKARAINKLKKLGKYGIQMGPPHVVHVRDRIYRLRLRTNHGHHRFLFFLFQGKKFIILHAFTKQTDAIPQKEIDMAMNYRDDYVSRNK